MEKNLTLINKNGTLLADSREVAEMVGKQHSHLCRDIQGYINVLATNPKLDSLNFFVESNYKDKKGEVRKCYLLTKKGIQYKPVNAKCWHLYKKYEDAYKYARIVIERNCGYTYPCLKWTPDGVILIESVLRGEVI